MRLAFWLLLDFHWRRLVDLEHRVVKALLLFFKAVLRTLNGAANSVVSTEFSRLAIVARINIQQVERLLEVIVVVRNSKTDFLLSGGILRLFGWLHSKIIKL